ncbi:hypothetical protein J2046_002123 [Rhizobium petrolearium]|uniref:hypothetical protein n=1 Tax=Neorhizobium petrolearium TaxID=515361 RepID=UPI001AE56310|nr:hypothetical protein [Neorhizobium petrolearium]MBP1843867.1 hypothetical protein [Neorhizobium petrolearium]
MLTALENLDLVIALRRSVWAYPIISWLHILGIGLLFGSIAVVDLYLLGLMRKLDGSAVRRSLVPVAIAGFCLAAATGLLLFAPAAREYLASPFFRLKLLLLLLAGGNAVLLRNLDGRNIRHAAAPLCGLASLALWVSIIFAGRMLAFG